jgi:hypothetical protein
MAAEADLEIAVEIQSHIFELQVIAQLERMDAQVPHGMMYSTTT